MIFIEIIFHWWISFYEIDYCAQLNNWKTKYFVCILRSHLINAFSLYRVYVDITWHDFRQEFIDWLFEESLQ